MVGMLGSSVFFAIGPYFSIKAKSLVAAVVAGRLLLWPLVVLPLLWRRVRRDVPLRATMLRAALVVPVGMRVGAGVAHAGRWLLVSGARWERLGDARVRGERRRVSRHEMARITLPHTRYRTQARLL